MDASLLGARATHRCRHKSRRSSLTQATARGLLCACILLGALVPRTVAKPGPRAGSSVVCSLYVATAMTLSAMLGRWTATYPSAGDGAAMFEAADVVWPAKAAELDPGEVAALNRSEFMRAFVRASQPVVLRGAGRQWMDFESMAASPDELAARFGDADVQVEMSPDKFFHNTEAGYRVVRPEKTMMRFRDFLGHMKLESKPSQHVEHGSRRMHVAIEQMELRDELPDMADLVEVPAIASQLSLLHVNYWYAPSRKVSVLHHDSYENLLCVVQGTKQVRLYGPEQTPYLYPTEMHEYFLRVGDHGKLRVVPGDDVVENFSPINISHPDLHRYPKFSQAKGFDVTLREGDVLFLPSFWWHQVTSSGGRHGPCVALNLWFEPVSDLGARLWRVLYTDVLADAGSRTPVMWWVRQLSTDAVTTLGVGWGRLVRWVVGTGAVTPSGGAEGGGPGGRQATVPSPTVGGGPTTAPELEL